MGHLSGAWIDVEPVQRPEDFWRGKRGLGADPQPRLFKEVVAAEQEMPRTHCGIEDAYIVESQGTALADLANEQGGFNLVAGLAKAAAEGVLYQPVHDVARCKELIPDR